MTNSVLRVKPPLAGAHAVKIASVYTKIPTANLTVRELSVAHTNGVSAIQNAIGNS